MNLSFAAGNAAVNAVTALLNVGGAGTIKVYTGSAPATPESSLTGTLLATLTLNSTSFGSASSGTATANAIANASAAATGTAGYAALCNNAGTCVALCSVGTSGADLNFNTLSFTSGDTISVSSLTITQPSS